MVFQTFDLLADGRLRAMNAFTRAGKPTGIDHRHEATQQLEIQHRGPYLVFH
jgi:hypothetical protein